MGAAKSNSLSSVSPGMSRLALPCKWNFHACVVCVVVVVFVVGEGERETLCGGLWGVEGGNEQRNGEGGFLIGHLQGLIKAAY